MARFSKKRSNVRLKSRSRDQPATKEEKESKAQYEQARRRQWCVVKKTNELHSLCNKKVFLLVVDDRRADFLSSEDISEDWPYSWQRLMSDPTVRRITYKTKPQTQHSDKPYPLVTPNQAWGEVTPVDSEDSEDSLQPIQSFLRVHELGRLLEQFHHLGRHRAAFLKGLRVALFGDSGRLPVQEQPIYDFSDRTHMPVTKVTQTKLTPLLVAAESYTAEDCNIGAVQRKVPFDQFVPPVPVPMPVAITVFMFIPVPERVPAPVPVPVNPLPLPPEHGTPPVIEIDGRALAGGGNGTTDLGVFVVSDDVAALLAVVAAVVAVPVVLVAVSVTIGVESWLSGAPLKVLGRADDCSDCVTEVTAMLFCPHISQKLPREMNPDGGID